jgi:Zn-dependent protease with chaperone function
MDRHRLLLLLGLICAAATGCASSSDPHDAWVTRCGGLSADREAVQRVQALADRVTARPVMIDVLDRPDLAAFSWPNGRIYLSRGLVEALDDELLTAAVAHEIGHLLNHGASKRPAALRGTPTALAAEIAADRAGMQLLVRRGHRRDAMQRMLSHVVAQPNLPDHVKAQLRHRIAALD